MVPEACLKKYSEINLKRMLYRREIVIIQVALGLSGTAVTQQLRYCATNRKVACSIPAGVIGIFH